MPTVDQRGRVREEELPGTNASKRHLYDVARQLGVDGRSTMTRSELVDAIRRANDSAARRARER